ncbi:MAG: hypothetical protein JO056_11605 [Alphaproteobacteria bacterium]|nr:hypothetical protein [Alphaproteobacteria bacterium]
MRRNFVVSLVFGLALSASASAGTVTQLAHQPPEGSIITMLMTDGTVLAQGFSQTGWWKLTPDNMGSYVNGTWTQVASLPSGYAPDAMAESVLPDGKLIIAGGEYNFGSFAFTNQSALYDPFKNKWTDVTPDKHLLNFIGDSGSNVLPDGRFLVAKKFSKGMYAFDSKTMTWSKLKSKGKDESFNSEEGLQLLPDGSYLVVEVKGHPKTQRYVPSSGQWVDAGSTPVDLRGPQNCCGHCIPYGPKDKCYDPPGETGASALLPNGTVFFSGSIPEGENTAHTAIYNIAQNKWTKGPDIPNGDEAFDTGVSALPNGNALVEGYNGTFYEFDGTKLVTQSGSGSFGGDCMTNLPSGEILVGGFEVYKPAGTYQAAWQPAITDVPASVTRGQTYKITGKQFNGISQGSSFGDEFDSHSNYPLVRITNNSSHHVFYARTHDHSTMGVATGTKSVFTNFDVPSGMETGASKIEVVANGIPSAPVNITVN